MLEWLTEVIRGHVSLDSFDNFVTMLCAAFLKAKVEDHYSSSFLFHVSCLVATFVVSSLCIYLFLRGFVFFVSRI